MIVGSHSLDPRRVLTASYSIATNNVYIFKVGYLIGNELMELSQVGNLKECKKWLTIVNSVIGKGPLMDAVATKQLDDNELDDTVERKIGFVCNQ